MIKQNWRSRIFSSFKSEALLLSCKSANYIQAARQPQPAQPVQLSFWFAEIAVLVVNCLSRVAPESGKSELEKCFSSSTRIFEIEKHRLSLLLFLFQIEK